MAPPDQIGPYKVLGVLGAGGMGVVYRARRGDAGPQVALKVASAKPGLVASLRSEIRTMQRVDHPGVVRILDSGVADGAPWYAMTLLEGRTWADFVRDLWPHAASGASSTMDLLEETRELPAYTPGPRSAAAAGRLDEVLDLVSRLCFPLAVLHGRGIVHRDLKPSNLFLTDDGEPVILDLGLAARGRDGARDRFEAATGVAGSLPYMAPEQLRGARVDARADLYALGCILFELITGEVPFSAPSVPALTDIVLKVPASRPGLKVDGVPPHVDELVLRLLAKEPRERMGYAVDVARALGGAEKPGRAGGQPYLYRPSLEGRDALVSAMTARIVQANQGEGSFTLLGGESGVGKTQLVTELGRIARRHRLWLAGGECMSVGVVDRSAQELVGTPLHPLRPVLLELADRCRTAGAPTCDRVFGPHRRVLDPYEPALATLPGDPGPPPIPLFGALERQRVVRALGSVFAGAAQAFGPGMVLLDDIQWADDVSLAFLASLQADWFKAAPIVLVATSRTDERSAAIDQLRGSPAVRFEPVERLTLEAVGRMIGAMLALPEAPPAAFVEFVYRQSEGNPFFVAEYLQGAVAEGLITRTDGRWQLVGEAADLERLAQPGSLRALVSRRLAELTPGAIAVVEALATLGRETDLALALRLSEQGEEAVLEGVRELRERQVVELTGDGRVRFLHDKLRERALAGVAPERAILLHRRAAEALEQLPLAEQNPALLGHHWRQAGAWERALHHLERAAELALARFANQEARQHVAALKAVAANLPGGVTDQRAARWERFLSDTHLELGEYEEARVHGERSLAQLGLPFPSGSFGLGIGLLRSIVAITWRAQVRSAGVPRTPAERERREEALQVLASFQELFLFLDRPIHAVYSGLRAIALGSPMGVSRPLARAYALMSTIVGTTPLKGVARAWHTRALELSSAIGDPMTQAYVDIRVSANAIYAADWDQFDRLHGSAVAVATPARDDRRLNDAELLRGYVAYIRGRYTAALRGCQAVERGAIELQNPQSTTYGVTGQVQALVRLGRVEEAEARLRSLSARLEGEGNAAERFLAGGLWPLLHLEQGRPREAAAAIESALKLLSGPVVLWFYLPALWALAETAVRLVAKDPSREHLRLAKRTLAVTDQAGGTFAVAVARANLYRALLAEGAGRPATAAALRALAAAERCQLPWEEAQARLLLARVDPSSATDHRARARVLLQGCEAVRELAALDEPRR